jgi:hypothetical protein
VNKNIILIAALGAAVLLVLKKQTQAAQAALPAMTTAQKQAAGLLYAPPKTQQVNVMGDMFTRLLGDGWRNLSSAQNSDGSPAFIKNVWGQVSTSDGRPVGGEDPGAAYMEALAGIPSDSGQNYLASISPYDAYLDTSGTPQELGW